METQAPEGMTQVPDGAKQILQSFAHSDALEQNETGEVLIPACIGITSIRTNDESGNVNYSYHRGSITLGREEYLRMREILDRGQVAYISVRVYEDARNLLRGARGEGVEYSES